MAAQDTQKFEVAYSGLTKMTIPELLKHVDRSAPEVKALAERLEEVTKVIEKS